jgi:hypothetical protein
MRSKRAILFVGVICAIVLFGWWLHLSLLDGLIGSGLARVVGEDTIYAAAYSEHRFRQVRNGMDQKHVFELLGPPLKQSWVYGSANSDPLIITAAPDGRIQYVSGPATPTTQRIVKGMRLEDVRSVIGQPAKVVWAYSTSAHDSSYRIRAIIFRNNAVSETRHEYYWD